MTAELSPTERLTKEEREVSRRLSRGFAWPTVVLLVALIAIEIAVVAAWATGFVPLLVGMFINSVASYGLYTVVHDAVHRSISNRSARHARWDSICGNIAGQLILLNFAGHRSSHLRHHAHTNTDRDPDLGAKGPMVALPVKWLVGNLVLLLVALPGGVRLATALMRRLGADAATDGGEGSAVDHPGAAHVPVPGVLLRLVTALPLRRHRAVPQHSHHPLSRVDVVAPAAGPAPHPSPVSVDSLVPVPGGT
jgi:hypothetical protein